MLSPIYMVCIRKETKTVSHDILQLYHWFKSEKSATDTTQRHIQCSATWFRPGRPHSFGLGLTIQMTRQM